MREELLLNLCLAALGLLVGLAVPAPTRYYCKKRAQLAEDFELPLDTLR